MLLKIGELARRTGLTVRTLHHYDAIGLLCPSARSDSGYRLYNRQDIARLHRIQALRRLDLALSDIASLLEGGSTDLQTVIEQQIALLDLQARRTIALRDRLKGLLEHVAGNVEPDLSDWLVTLEMMSMYDKYFTRDELATLRVLRDTADKDVTSQSKPLIAQIRSLMDRKVPPESSEAQSLSRAWMALVHERMGGDARLIRKLDAMHRNESAVQALTGVDGAMIDYMATASIARRLTVYRTYIGDKELPQLFEKFSTCRRSWLEAAAEVRDMVDKGVDPRSAAAQKLCAHWIALATTVWGDDPDVHEKIRLAHEKEPSLLIGTGVNKEVIAFLTSGIEHLLERQKTKTGTSHA